MRYSIGALVLFIVCGTASWSARDAVSAQSTPPAAEPKAAPRQESNEETEIRNSFARANIARQKLWAELYEKLDAEDNSLAQIPMTVSNEYQEHALRMAKLARIGAIAQKLNNDRVKQRVSTAISLENDRHKKAIEPLLKEWKKKL